MVADLTSPIADQKTPAISTSKEDDSFVSPSSRTLTRWEKIQDVVWDGGHRTAEERKLVQRLDIHVMSWATFGYFIRLLDSTNITNAYVSGMKEDLDFRGNQYNLLTTFFTCGYLVGQIPSQFLLTRGRCLL